MAGIAGYALGEELYHSKNSIIHRATAPDGRPVVVKMLPEEFPSPDRIARLRREYQMTSRLRGEGIINVIGLERHQNSLAIIVEDFGGESLTRLLRTHEFDTTQRVELGAKVARALASVHARQVMHKDVNPSNIVWNVDTGDVKLIDFGISTELSRESQAARNPSVLEGTLAYTSPEQTGRMNRSMDYRTDLYSFGATLYHLFTGAPPFVVDDPMELVHCHIARLPRPVGEVVGEAGGEVPAVLARIIHKLLEKSADDRYQTAAALAADLERCLAELQRGGPIRDFEIAASDVSDRFEIPQRLYGRDAEVRVLLDAFGRVADGAKEMLLVAGYSGIGKSALVHEVHRPIVERRGYFISGKFDLLARNIPYASLIQAVQGLVRQLLTESADELEQWRERILAAVGVNGAVITEVIGEVELIVGRQPPVPELAPAEARNRFNIVFADFIRTFAAAEHPLTLFLDDLQWADLPSLQLVRQFMTDLETSHMLLIGAYRDNEVDPTHALMLTLDEMRAEQAVIDTITLEPIPGRYVNQLIADTLKQDEYSVASLTGVCMEKTQGNPFFLGRFLIALYEGGAIDFDAGKGAWTWDLRAIETMEITDNVVDLMARKIGQLPEATQRVLELAACIGNTFDLKTLAIVHERPVLETAQDLWQAMSEGLVLPLDASYKFLETGLDGGEADEQAAERARYRFLHDRVQQAAYSLIAEDDKRSLHGRVGRLLLDQLAEEEREEQIFAIVGHLNVGRGLIADAGERADLARLNLEVGRKAIASAAYAPAASYLAIGIELMPDDAWEADYAVMLALHEEAALASTLAGEFAEMARYAALVDTHAREVLDRVRTYETRLASFVAQADFPGAVDVALEILGHLGQSFPDEPSDADVAQGFGEIAEAIGERDVESLAELPRCEDPVIAAAIRLCALLVPPAYIGRPALMPLAVIRCVNLSVRHGNIGASGFAYATYAILLSGVIQDPRTAARFATLGQVVVDRFDAREFAARTHYIPCCFVNFWNGHGRLSVDGHLPVYQLAVETGELQFAAWAIMKRAHQSFMIGLELTRADRAAAEAMNACAKIRQEAQVLFSAATRQAIHNLMGNNAEPARLVGEFFDEDVCLPRHIERRELFGVCNLLVTKIYLAYLFDEYDRGVEYSEQLEPYYGAMVGLMHVPVFHVYDCLIRLARYPFAGADEQARIMARVDETIPKLEHWASNAPESFLHRLRLVQGERAVALGEPKEARRLFKESARVAADNDYLHEEALAYELTGRVWLREDEHEIAGLFLTKARHRYQVWGAKAKAAQLASKHEGLLLRSELGPRPATGVSPTTSQTGATTSGTSALDLDTVLKATQAISREIVFGRLLERLVQIAIENAGAERGVLLLDDGEGLAVVAAAEAGEEPRLTDAAEYAQGIVAYVTRVRDHVVLSDATEVGRFTGDAYVVRRKPRSVLCTPIVHQGEMTGVIYLENNLTTDAFTEHRLRVLEMLLGQLAISIDNARLYRTLEDKVRERTQQLERRNHFIKETFGRYLSDEIVDSLLDSPDALRLGGEKRKVTIMMTDLRGFTAMSETLPPEKVVAVINNYLGVMTEVVMRYEGTIDEFIGDAILVIFGAPIVRPDDAERAAACALAMQLAMDEVNAANAEQGLPQVEMGIGINTGHVVVGNIGSVRRAKYGVVGSSVNLASRIESYTIGGQILIAESTLAEVREIAELGGQLEVQPKGVTEPMTIHDLTGLGGRHGLRLERRRLPLVALAAPAPVRFVVLAAGDAVPETRDGALVGLSASEAEMTCEGGLVALSNVMLSRIGETEVELYAKVVPGDGEGHRLHFTSMSDAARAALDALAGD